MGYGYSEGIYIYSVLCAHINLLVIFMNEGCIQ
jgi:hypothetical protein